VSGNNAYCITAASVYGFTWCRFYVHSAATFVVCDRLLYDKADTGALLQTKQLGLTAQFRVNDGIRIKEKVCALILLLAVNNDEAITISVFFPESWHIPTLDRATKELSALCRIP